MFGQMVDTCLQYGALGLCASMVVMNWFDRRSMARELDARNERMEKLLRQNIDAWNQVANALGDRPCLRKDSRIDKLAEAGS